MKKILFSGFCALVATSAFAADMPVKAPVAPAVAAFRWTGCYVGIHGGYGWGRNNNQFGQAIASGGTEGGETFEFGPYDQNLDGGIFGGQVGCNYQFQQNWVIGGEGEFYWTGMKGSVITPEDGPDPGTFSQFQVKNRWDGDIAARVGYAWDRSLLYGKVGAAWGNFRYIETHDDFPVDNGCNSCSVTFDKTRVGLLLGVGWEYAFLDNWTIKVEYNHIDFGSHHIPYPNANATIQSFEVSDRKDIVKVGVNYLFH
jgi:outer membrane immunogenic protein